MGLDDASASASVKWAHALLADRERRSHADEEWVRRLCAEVGDAMRDMIDKLDKAGRPGATRVDIPPRHGWPRPRGWCVSKAFIAVDGRTWYRWSSPPVYTPVTHEEFAYRVIVVDREDDEVEVYPGDPGFRDAATRRASSVVRSCAELLAELGVA